MEGDFASALALVGSFVEDTRRRNDAQNVQGALLLQADFALQLGHLDLAHVAAREAVGVPTVELGAALNAQVTLAEVAALQLAADAEGLLAHAERTAEEPETESEHPQLLRARGLSLRAAGDLPAARDKLLASAALARAQSAIVQLGRTLAVLAEVALALEDQATATSADTERARIVERIGPAVRGLTWAARARPAPERGSHPLTPREQEVAVLVARGLTNSQIARALVITERTVAAHIEHMHAKLGFNSRTQIGVWASERGLTG